MKTSRQLLTWAAAGLLAVLAVDPAGPAHAAVFLSEYVEGTGSNKALEVFNSGRSEVDLSGFELRVFANGSSSPTGTLGLTGRSLAAGDTLVLAHPSAGPALLALAQVTSGVLNFNGDDAIGLFAGGVLVDGFGQAGLDPGDAWVSGPVATRDMTLRRIATVTGGDPSLADAFDPAREWQPLPIDTLAGLGEHATAPTPAPLPSALLLLASALGALGLQHRSRENRRPALAA